MTDRLEVQVIALAESQSRSGHYVLILEEPKSKRRIPLIIGAFEAQAIAIHLEALHPPRMLTHDLLRAVVQELGANLKEAFLYKLESDIFFAQLFFFKADGALFSLETRPSDAIALAVRFDAPIYTTEAVLDEAAYLIDEKGKEKKSYSEFTIEELEELLRKVLEKEDYESAARIKAMIAKKLGGK